MDDIESVRSFFLDHLNHLLKENLEEGRGGDVRFVHCSSLTA